MENSILNEWETRLANTAAHLAYPPTPPIDTTPIQAPGARNLLVGRSISIRIAAGALALFLIMLAVAIAVPQVRAAVLDFLQIGAIGIQVSETPVAQAPTFDGIIPDLYGRTTLEEAAAQADFPVRLPEYPSGIGRPDSVYLQEVKDLELDGQVLILVWQHAEQPGEAELSLSLINVPFYGIKGASLNILQETRVGGQPAYWIQGPHQLQLRDGSYQERLIVSGNVLVWTEGELTYRLESGLSMEEAVNIAESLKPLHEN